MKYLKPILISSLALAALVVAAPSASAAKLCSTAGTGAACGAGHGRVYTGSLVGKSTGNSVFTITSASGTILTVTTCTASELGGGITNGEIGSGSFNKLVFTGCSSPFCSETFTTNAATSPWPFSVNTEAASENTNGIVAWEGMTLTYTCSSFPAPCKYKAAKEEAKLDGSDTEPKLTISVSLEKEEGVEAACGAKIDWSNTYRITTPTSLFVE